MIPRALKSVFDEAKRLGATSTSKIYISFTEIYNEAVYDLLDSEKRYHTIEEWTKAQVLEGDEGLVIRNVNVFEVAAVEDALNLFFMGTTNRFDVHGRVISHRLF